ncbi:MAG: hypothetical protein WCZ43_08205 [Proteiniphilum sp.]
MTTEDILKLRDQGEVSEDNRLSFSNNESSREFVITIARNEEPDSDTFPEDSDTFSPDLDTKKQKPLSKKQKDILNFCNIPRSSKEILKRAEVSYHSKNIERYINVLVEAGYLEMTNPENPNASNQKYRKKIKQ